MSTINTYRTLTLSALAILFFLASCQKKFDPKSYAPDQSFGGYNTSNEIAPTDLVAHFSFEGNLTDSISNTTATNFGTSFSTGIKGQSLQVGLNNYAVFTPTPAIKALQNITISFWINTPTNAAGIQTPVSFVNPTQFWGNFDAYFDGQTATDGFLKWHIYGSGGSTEKFLDQWKITNIWGTWKHYVLTYDATSANFIFYVNGAQFATTNVPAFGSLNFANCPALVLGTIQFMTTPSETTNTGPQSWASYLLGNMDELRIYDKALAPADIKALYQLENLGR
jgi:hypothetical protein